MTQRFNSRIDALLTALAADTSDAVEEQLQFFDVNDIVAVLAKWLLDVEAGGSSSFRGWALDYDANANGSVQQVIPHDGTALNPIFNVEVFDTDGFHAANADHVVIPSGMAGVYDLRLVVVTGGAVGTDIGSRFAYFARNRPTYDPIPGYWQVGQSDLIPADVNFQGQIAVFAELDEGDTVAVEMFTLNYTSDLPVTFDSVYHQDTYFMGRYLGPVAT